MDLFDMTYKDCIHYLIIAFCLGLVLVAMSAKETEIVYQEKTAPEGMCSYPFSPIYVENYGWLCANYIVDPSQVMIDDRTNECFVAVDGTYIHLDKMNCSQ